MPFWAGCCHFWSRHATTRRCSDSPIMPNFGGRLRMLPRMRPSPLIRAVRRGRDNFAWEKAMRKGWLGIFLVAFACHPASAADPVGEWLVKDGGAQIRIEPCADALWGVISWTRE